MSKHFGLQSHIIHLILGDINGIIVEIKQGVKIMNDMIRIYLYKIANLLAYPFLKLRGYRLGVEAVADEFITLMRKVCVQDSFHHSFENTYVQYSLFNGIFFKEDRYNQGVLSASKNVCKDGTMEVNRLELKNVKAFERFCADIKNNHAAMRERWTLNYKNKQINSIVCKLDIIPDYINHRTKRIEAVKLAIVFDHEFKVLSIIKQYFVIIRSKHGDETVEMPVYRSIIEGEISLDTEFLLINLATATDNSPLIDMFPEYFMTTVYDYSSTEFEQRLQLYNMVSY